MTETIYLVGCGKNKAPINMPARHLYTGQLFKSAYQVAEQTGNRWFVLSAMHGLIHPDTEVEPYNWRLHKGMYQRWSCKVVEQLRELGIRDARLVILAGKDYADPVGLFERCGYQIELPMAGMGIGQRLGWLKQQRRS